MPHGLFTAAVARHQGEKHAKGMTWRSQFVALLFCHLGESRSLRETTAGLAASEGKLRHLGVERATTCSTLAYANEHRSRQIYGRDETAPGAGPSGPSAAAARVWMPGAAGCAAGWAAPRAHARKPSGKRRLSSARANSMMRAVLLISSDS